MPINPGCDGTNIVTGRQQMPPQNSGKTWHLAYGACHQAGSSRHDQIDNLIAATNCAWCKKRRNYVGQKSITKIHVANAFPQAEAKLDLESSRAEVPKKYPGFAVALLSSDT
jgi:hypothetical protein